MRLAVRLFASVLLLTISLPVGVAFADTDTLTVTLNSTETAGVADTSMTVTAMAGPDVDTGYGGTVHFTTSDGGDVSIPPDYTFQPTDSGSATFSVTFTTSGPQTITATDTGDGTITGTGSTTVDAAAAFSIDLGNTSTGNLASGQTRNVTALVLDAFNNPVVGQSVAFVASGSGTVTGTGSFPTDATGTATDPVTAVLAGTVTITGTTADAGSNGVIFPVVAGAANHLDLSALTTNLGSGTTRLLTATLTDAAGNGVPNQTITLGQSGAGDVSNLTNPITNNSGVAVDTVTGHGAGLVTITATAGVLTDNVAFTVIAGAPFGIVVTGGTGNLTSGASRTLTATLTDAAGNPIAGQPIGFSRLTGPGSVSFGPPTTTNSLGQSTDLVTGVGAGAITISAADGGVNGSIAFTIVPGAPLHLVLTGTTTSLTSGSGRILTATVTDAAGNGISGESVTLSQTGSITGTVSGLTTATTGGSGALNESVTGLHAGSVSIIATDGGLTSNTLTFTVVPGAPFSLIVGGSTLSLASGATRGLTATVTDANNNGISGEQVFFTASTPPGSVSGLTNPTTGAGGVASVTVTGVLAGSVTITATDGGLSNDLTFTVTAGATNHITVSPSTSSITPGSQAYTTTAFDTAGNSTDVTGTANLSIAGGICDLTSCSASSVGAHTVTATFAGKTAIATLTILNVAPTANADAVSINEDSASKEFEVLANDTDPNFDTLSVTAVSTPAHGTATVDSDGGGIHYQPAAHYNGPDSFDYSIADGHGGVDTTTVTVTIVHVNEVPFFTKGANQTVFENSSPGPVSGWATGMSPGLDPTESGQALNFIVSSNNPGLFSAGPAIDSSGNLTYTPAPNTSGVATVSVQIHDDGGTDLGGVDTSAIQTFTISVTFVNQAPSFTEGADQAIFEDAGPIAAPGWASAISSGPGDPTQTLNFIVTNDNNALFTSGGQPAINAAGLLTYTTAPNANGTTTVSVSLHDNGGTANGGVDTSALQTFTITVTPVNDAPSFVKGPNISIPQASPPPALETVSGWATGFNPGGGPDESGQTVLAYHVTNNHNGLFQTQPSIDTSGTLTYKLAANENGVVTVSVSVQDNGGTANGGVDTSPVQTFTITITGVDNPPGTQTDSPTVVQGSGPNTIDVLSNDFDQDSDPLTVVGVCIPVEPYPCYHSWSTGHGLASVSADGLSVTYDPTGSFSGTDTFLYRISDGRGGTAYGTVVVTVVKDTFGPVATAPKIIATGTTSTTVTIMLRWSGTDQGFGVKYYQLQESHNGGTYVSVTVPVGATSVARTVTNGGTYTYRVRGVDLVGNIGAWVTSDPFVPATVPRPAPPTRRHGSVSFIDSDHPATSTRGTTIIIVQP